MTSRPIQASLRECAVVLLGLAFPATPAVRGEEPAASARRMASRSPTAYFATAITGWRPRSIERFLEAAKPGPDADDARFGLANSLLFLNKYQDARRQFEAFLKETPDHPNAPTAQFRVGETAFLAGDLKAARDALEAFTKSASGASECGNGLAKAG